MAEDTHTLVLSGVKTAISAVHHRKPVTVGKAQAWNLPPSEH